MATLNTLRESKVAWKYAGYPAFSEFLATSADCLLLRKFNSLNVRILLKAQNEIVTLERKLADMDEYTMNLPADAGGCGSLRLDENTPRDQLLDELSVLVHDYNTRLHAYLLIAERPAPIIEQVENVELWLSNRPNAIERDELEFLRQQDDLLTLRPTRRTYFGWLMRKWGFWRVAERSVSSSTSYYDRNRWKRYGGVLLLFTALSMSLGPLWALAYINGRTTRLATSTAFVCAFTIMVLGATTMNASRRSIAIAGYLALIVLILLQSSTWGTSTKNDAEPATSNTTLGVTHTALEPVSTGNTTVSVSTTSEPSLSASDGGHSQTLSSGFSTSSTRSTTLVTSTFSAPSSSVTYTGKERINPDLSTGAKVGIGLGAAAAVSILAVFIPRLGRRKGWGSRSPMQKTPRQSRPRTSRHHIQY